MSTRTLVVRSVAAALTLAVAVFVLLAGFDVLEWRGNDARLRAEFALATGDADVQPNTLLPVAVSRSLLDADDSVSFDRVLARWPQILTQPFHGTRAAAQVGNAELELERLSKSHALSARARANALLMHSILLLEELGSQANSPDNPGIVARPLGEMRRAVLLDPANVFAKRNVEVTLRIYPPSATRTPAPGTVPLVGAPKGVKGGRGQGGTSDAGGGF